MQSDDSALIPLWGRGGVIRAYAVVDAADAEWANRWRWYLGSYGCAVRNRDANDPPWMNKTPQMHRRLLDLPPGRVPEVDHRDHDRLNNRRANLRTVPKGSQPQNTSSAASSTSKYLGVSFKTERGKWVAQVRAQGVNHHLGYFATEEEAAAAAQEARRRLLPYAID